MIPRISALVWMVPSMSLISACSVTSSNVKHVESKDVPGNTRENSENDECGDVRTMRDIEGSGLTVSSKPERKTIKVALGCPSGQVMAEISPDSRAGACICQCHNGEWCCTSTAVRGDPVCGPTPLCPRRPPVLPR